MHYQVKLKNINQTCEIKRLPDSAQGFVLSAILKNIKNDAIFIAQSAKEMQALEAQIKFFSPSIEEEFDIINFPAWDCLPFDRSSPKALISNMRLRCLYKILNKNSEKKLLIITSLHAILQKIISPKELGNYGLQVKAKSKISIEQICNFLIIGGYTRSASANASGEFAVRGGIVDFVSEKNGELIGYRIDFFGDEIESIKAFDPLTQTSHEHLREITILPSSEVFLNDKTIATFRSKYRQKFGAAIDDQLYSAISDKRSYFGMEHWLPLFYEEDLVTLFDYFSDATIFYNQKIFTHANERQKLISEYYEARIHDKKINKDVYNAIEPNLLYVDLETLQKKINHNTNISFNNFDNSSDVTLRQAQGDKRDFDKRIFDLEIKPVPDFYLAGHSNKQSPFALFKEHFPLDKNHKLIICCLSDTTRSQINRILHDYEIHSTIIDDYSKIEKIKNSVALVNLPLEHGFQTTDYTFISEQDLLGQKIIHKKKSDKQASQRLIEEGLAINLGELVVHRDHGIGKFDGIHVVSALDVKTDMIKILYGGGDTLFVPVDDINLITRYGADNPLIQLDRLGVAAWKNRKEKVRNKIKVAAEELLKIAAARHVKKAPILIPDQHFYDEFKARFGFVETEDQARAISEVEEDLQKGLPMDRLICGDVGFGKTEVAMRAAAIAVSNNIKYQVAIITPTTLLCRQHFKNFSKRFEDAGIKVAQLSRLVGTTESKKVKEKIESGEIDIVIGTHALLQKNIKFKNLALVIIDEEQHFGVAQKERLKELRNEVHVLTLSATPIPRTLQMSLTGVKDLSLISSAPIDRIAVRNFIMPYDSVVIREAVMREYNRSGRVFFVVPRIRDIEEIENKLKTLLPEIKIMSAHGRMTPAQLDKIMNDFVDGRIDLLLSTTIIESGIDIAEANTIIIYKAEMFGLAQLYQLRGRVGRGKVRAYAYFMLKENKKLSDEAHKKLEVMQNLDALGVGFSIASHDMDIRGSGNLLSEEQSGHIKETGVELYQQLLFETIQNIKNKEPNVEITNSDFTCAIKLGISLLIPENYMPDLSLRMNFYKRIANLSNQDDEEKLRAEMLDRFGKIPDEVINLMEIAKLKHICRKLDIERLEAIANGIVVSFKDNKFKNPDKLLQAVFSKNSQIKIHNGQKLLFLLDVSTFSAKIDSAFMAVKKLENLL